MNVLPGVSDNEVAGAGGGRGFPPGRRRCRRAAVAAVSVAAAFAAGGCASAGRGAECASPALFAVGELPASPVPGGAEASGSWRRTPFAYDSPGGGRVPAMMWDPVAAGRRPVVILAHGMPGDRTSLWSLAEAYASAGARVLSITAPWSRPDSEVREPALFTLPLFSAADRTELIQYVRDLRRLVDVAMSLPDADPSAIVFVGHSYGGVAGGILTGIEPRIVAFALASSPGGLRDRFPQEWAAGDSPGGVDRPLGSEAWANVLADIDARCFLRRAQGERLLLQFGLSDHLVPPVVARRVESALPAGATVRWYDAGHGLTPRAWAEQAAWFADRIELDLSRFGSPVLRSGG